MAFADSIRTVTPTMEGVASLIETLHTANEWQTWTPTLAGFSANPTNTMYRYRLDNGGCWVAVRQTTDGTSNGTSFTISAPVVAATVTNGYWGCLLWRANDNGAAIQNGRAYIASASSSIILEPNMSGGTWTAANGKSADFVLFYEV